MIAKVAKENDISKDKKGQDDPTYVKKTGQFLETNKRLLAGSNTKKVVYNDTTSITASFIDRRASGPNGTTEICCFIFGRIC